MRFHRIAPEERSYFQRGIAAIEQAALYPLGDDFFQIDHGSNYFAFFDRLGAVSYYVALDGNAEQCPLWDNRVAAVGAGVLRQVAYRQGEEPRLAWYLCDLKVHPDYQQQRLSLRLLTHALKPNLRHCSQGYAISMNPANLTGTLENRQGNQLVRVLEKFAPLPFRYSTLLEIYSLDAKQMSLLQPLLVEHRGPVSYLALKGIKDLRLKSSGQLMPLLHVQWGATAAAGRSEPLPGSIHMLCTPAVDELARALRQRGSVPTATASVVSYNMEQSDWRFILTSDI